jgi:hypothetical protein
MPVTQLVEGWASGGTFGRGDREASGDGSIAL